MTWPFTLRSHCPVISNGHAHLNRIYGTKVHGVSPLMQQAYDRIKRAAKMKRRKK